ncbi:MAG: restriction endonuclease subunit S [Verrucomicrobia bacterium]|nr:restriction endonuclease subunit S [Verrucomicrobiota bacterium]
MKKRFADFVTLQRGFDLPKTEMRDGPFPVIGSTSVIGHHDVYKVEPPGVVTGRSGSLGTVQFINERYWPHNTSLWVRDFKGNDARFVYYCLQGLDFARFNAGAGVPTLNRNHLDTLEVDVPPLPVQRKIAGVLAAYDELIENNTRRIKLLEQMAQALYREWFVRPCHSAKLPKGWEMKKLGDIAEEDRRTVEPSEVDPNTPYFGLEHLPRKSIALTEWGTAKDVQSTKLAFKKGEILFGKIRPYFHKVGVAPLDGVCSSDTIVIHEKTPEYFGIVLCCVSSEAFVAHATQTSQGTKMPRANWDVLTKYPVALPPKPVLTEFNATINDYVALIQNLLFKNANLRRTRDLLLPKLISGEVDVSKLEIKTGEEAA